MHTDSAIALHYVARKGYSRWQTGKIIPHWWTGLDALNWNITKSEGFIYKFDSYDSYDLFYDSLYSIQVHLVFSDSFTWCTWF